MIKQFLAIVLLAASVGAQDTPTVYSGSATTLRITGGRANHIGGNAIYNFPEADVSIVNGEKTEARVFYLIDYNTIGDGVNGNIPQGTCFWSTDFPEGNYIECPADTVRTIQISLGPNPRNDLDLASELDPITGMAFQYPAITTIKIKSSGDTNDLNGLGTAPSALAQFPNLKKLQIEAKSFVVR